MRFHISARVLFLAAAATLLSCENTPTPLEPALGELSVANLAQRMGGNDVTKTAVLTDRYRALDSLYAIRFGVSRELPLSEARVMSAIDAAVGNTDPTADILNATRASQDLSLTPAQVAANAENIRALYRNLLAYQVYKILSAPSAQQASLTAAITLPSLINDAHQLWLLAVNPEKRDMTVLASVKAVQFAKDYFEEQRDPGDDAGYFVPDGTRSNAYMHAMWNVLIVHYCGYVFASTADALAWAKEFTDAHEGGNGSDGSAASDADQHNNAAGRALVGGVAYRDYTYRYEVATPPLATLKDMVRNKAEQALLIPADMRSAISTYPDYIFVFLKTPLTVKLVGTGAGTVRSALGSINCTRNSAGQQSGQCVFDVEADQVVRLTSTAATGSVFASWSGDCNASPCDVVMDGAKTVTARFDILHNYAISVSSSPSGGGTTSGSGNYPSGANVSLTALPASGFVFARWQENGSQISLTNPLQFVATTDRTLVAVFSAVQPTTYAVNVSASPSAGGIVSGSGNYAANTNVVVTAIPGNGYIFARWTESGVQVATAASYSFVATASRTLVAEFNQTAATTFAIGVSASPANGGTVAGSGTYSANANVTVTANAASGYSFVNWTENGQQMSTSANYSFTATASRTLVANFSVIAPTYTITTSSNPSNGGTTSGGGIKNANTSVTVSATPANGYSFVNWTESGNAVSTSSSYSFTATGSRSLVANFNQVAQTTYVISVSASPANGGTVAGSGTYSANANVTVTANAASGYSFVNWTENGTQVSASASYQFTVNGNRTLVANFSRTLVTYTISTSSNPSNGGTTSGGGTITVNPDVGPQTMTVSASAVSGYSFVSWTENGTQVSASSSYQFTLSRNRTLVANFSQNTVYYSVNVSASPFNGGNVSGGGNFAANSTVTLIATPLAGYTFASWTEGGQLVSTNSTYSFTATANRNLVANFNSSMTIPNAPTATLSFSTSAYVLLSWQDNSANETGFLIERAPGSTTTFAQVATVGANAPGYSDYAVALGSSYSYRVRAYNGAGTSGFISFGPFTVRPMATTLISPGSSSSPGPTISTVTPTFTWYSVGGSTNYGLAVRDLTTGLLVYDNDFLGNVTSKVLPAGTLVRGHNYKWDVRSSVNGVYSAYSADFYFRIQ